MLIENKLILTHLFGVPLQCQQYLMRFTKNAISDQIIVMLSTENLPCWHLDQQQLRKSEQLPGSCTFSRFATSWFLKENVPVSCYANICHQQISAYQNPARSVCCLEFLCNFGDFKTEQSFKYRYVNNVFLEPVQEQNVYKETLEFLTEQCSQKPKGDSPS